VTKAAAALGTRIPRIRDPRLSLTIARGLDALLCNLFRDRHRCQVPGCSRPAAHVHHIEYRAHGCNNDESNLLCLCAAHHLFGIHENRMQVTGKAPHELVWEFGLRRRWGANGSIVLS